MANDPLVVVHRAAPPDQELLAVAASSLAYGTVRSILASLERLAGFLGPAPIKLIQSSSRRDLVKRLRSFKHRFTTGEDLAAVLFNAGRLISGHGSLKKYLQTIHDPASETIEATAALFAEALSGPRAKAPKGVRSLVSSPRDKSACKRLMMLFRWMVRGPDGCDLGLWRSVISPAQLILPLDTHTARISRLLGLSRRKTADWRMALEVTAALRRIDPNDPVRYDFALSHWGIERFCRAGTPGDCVVCPLDEICTGEEQG